MFLGNTELGGMFIGDTPIKSIWLGTTSVWTNQYTYEVRDVVIKYSSGTKVMSDRSNYAYVSCTLKTYKNGTLVKTETNKPMSFTWTYPSVGAYCTVTPDSKIYFNPEYQTSNMSNHSDPLVTSLTAYLNGYNHTAQLYIYIEPNKLLTTTLRGYTSEINADTNILEASDTRLIMFPHFYENNYCTYTSGKNNIVKTEVTCYYFDADDNYLGECGSSIYKTISSNTNQYPILHQYRFSRSSTTKQSDDVVFSRMQRSKKKYDKNRILALYDKYGNEIVEGGSVKSEDINDVYLMNDVHKDGVTYHAITEASELEVYEQHGVLTITNIDSSTADYVTITANYTDENDYEWEETINFYVNYWM